MVSPSQDGASAPTPHPHRSRPYTDWVGLRPGFYMPVTGSGMPSVM
jgi:hypothetical protein